ncbi:MAG: gluconate 2-dehydrogenase subunit 3 family protein [Steroidobacteraceae bacterium]
MPDRRDTLRWLMRVLTLTASPALRLSPVRAEMPAAARDAQPPAERTGSASDGYGRDPDLLHPHIPWPLTLNPADKALVALLADVLLPRDGASPCASDLAVPEFLDEWISAPYPQQRADRATILAGLAQLRSEATGSLQSLDTTQSEAALARLCAQAAAGSASHARFFSRFRAICLIGYYTTMTGVAELGYVGYQPSATFSGPPAEVLARLGV